MKSMILLFVLFSALTPKNPTPLADPTTNYYFCCSVIRLNDEVKQYIYTDISSIHDNKDIIQQRANEWGEFVHKNCQQNMRCGSDLNIYKTYEEAVIASQRMMRSICVRPDIKVEKIQF